MTTFLPYADFRLSARVLDQARLGKQRVETLQIVKAHITGKGWIHHPATKMWRGYTRALIHYGQVICDEWVRRGFRDNTSEKLSEFITTDEFDQPPWLGDEKLHKSHRDVLLRKDPNWYSTFGWTSAPFVCYLWPQLSHDGKSYKLIEGRYL